MEAAPSLRGNIIEYFAANNYERIDEYLDHDVVNWYYRPQSSAHADERSP